MQALTSQLQCYKQHNLLPAASSGFAFQDDWLRVTGDLLTPHATASPPVPETIWQAWNVEPLLLLGFLVTIVLYARGIVALWRRAGAGHGVSFGQVVAFVLAILTLFMALISPLDALSEALLSVHMVQHLLLMLVAAPLLVYGMPPVALAWALPRNRQLARWWHRRRRLRRAWQSLMQPTIIWSLHALVLWVWHLPALYEAALQYESLHIVEHAMFLLAALLFWWALIWSGSLTVSTGILFVFATTLQSGLLAALLTFATQPWYPAYSVTSYAWGLTPLGDQQLAGAIMWFPGGLLYLFAMLLLLGAWLRQREQDEGIAGRVVRPPQRAVEVKL